MNNSIDYRKMINARQAYLIGIGGSGMSAVARLLHHHGAKVTGSDIKETATTHQLAASGITIHIGQDHPHFAPGTDLVIYSSAIHEDHPELRAARESGLFVAHRAEVLSSFVNAADTSIAVAGTHGKTTTSSMVSFVLSELGKDPTCLVGGDLMNFGTNALFGKSGIYVSEVDESDQTHELFYPHYAIITNLEEDHVDHYRVPGQLRHSFERFLTHLHNPGLVVYSEDDPELKSIVHASRCLRLSFGFSETADFSAQNVSRGPEGTSFDLYECGIFCTRIHLKLLGLHNVANALAATALLTHLGLDPEEIGACLARFRGAKRRLEVKYQSEQVIVVNDYAHHPTEVQASIRALQAHQKPLRVVFQPHRYSRTARFYRDFARVLNEVEHVLVMDIYGAGEDNAAHISAEDVVAEMRALGHVSAEVVSKYQVMTRMLEKGYTHGVVAFLGAGDIGDVANEFADRFKSAVAA